MTRRLVDFASSKLDSKGLTRRSFLYKLAMASTALAVAPLQFILRPQSAIATVCGPAPGCNDGWSAFCCTINRGLNNCPPGHVMGGWWRAQNSSYCITSAGATRARYYIDCHPRCTCTSGSANFCSSSCYACNCQCAEGPSCDKRRTCCAVFRYGQCNTQISQVGPVTCRVVTCTPPYQLFAACGTTLADSPSTANHTAPCLGVVTV